MIIFDKLPIQFKSIERFLSLININLPIDMK